MINAIFSKDNKTLKFIKSLHSKKGRKKSGCFFAEGERAVLDSAAENEKSVKYIVFSESYMEQNGEKVSGLEKKFECFYTSDKLFFQLCDTENPVGILAVFEIPKEKPLDLTGNKVLILDSLSDPGNMGTIIRTAEAMGFEDIILLGGCADVYSPKVVRATMGSVLRTNFFTGDKDFVSSLKEKGYSLYAAALCDGAKTPEKICPDKKSAVIIGNEANGISKEILEISDFYVKIPMRGKIESLNAAVAAAVIMYHFSLESD